MTTYVLAGGCFWCLDAVFRKLKGVESSLSGYAGGSAATAEYHAVASGQTEHAESVSITFDEFVIPAQTILDIFFLIHDPTTLNRQGNDVGPQYRSAMFYADTRQSEVFKAAVERAQTHWDDPIITELTKLEAFYEAEEEHQDYFNRAPNNPYCSIVINPKVFKSRTAYSHWFKEEKEELA